MNKLNESITAIILNNGEYYDYASTDTSNLTVESLAAGLASMNYELIGKSGIFICYNSANHIDARILLYGHTSSFIVYSANLVHKSLFQFKVGDRIKTKYDEEYEITAINSSTFEVLDYEKTTKTIPQEGCQLVGMSKC